MQTRWQTYWISPRDKGRVQSWKEEADDEFSNEYEYRCVINDAAGNSVTSNVVKVTEPDPLTIKMQPVSATVNIGDSGGAYVEVTDSKGNTATASVWIEVTDQIN